MPSTKCHSCGLVNFPNLEHCKRCRAELEKSSAPKISSRQPIGAWRDRCWLVRRLEAPPLDDVCIKCSETADVTFRRVAVKVYSAWSLVTQLAGVRLFWMINLEVPLCRRHRSGFDKLATAIILAGVLVFALGIASMRIDSIAPIVVTMLGFFVVAGGLLVYLVRRDKVKVWRYKDPYLWLWGAHRSYLDRLPNWSEREI
jgi:hypothetical protein